MRVEHIGIAVDDLESGVRLYERLLNSPCYKRETVESEKVATAFFLENGAKIELLADVHSGGTISKFIQKRGSGIHHIAFEVQDIREEMQRLREAGFQLLSEEPKLGADNKLICFVHPKDAGGVLIELCQAEVPLRGSE